MMRNNDYDRIPIRPAGLRGILLVEQKIRIGGVGPAGLVCKLFQNICIFSQFGHSRSDFLTVVLCCSQTVCRNVIELFLQVHAFCVKSICSAAESFNQTTLSFAGGTDLLFSNNTITQRSCVFKSGREDLVLASMFTSLQYASRWIS